MTAPRAFVGVRSRAGWWLTLPALLALAALLLFAAHRQGAFAQRDRLNFLAPSARGINPGMHVKLNGFVVGEVDAITLLPPAAESTLRVSVQMSIYRDHMRFIPRTTVARLTQESLIGQGVIELLPQRYDARAVASGEVLPFERSKDLGEIAAQLQDELTPVLRNSGQLSAALNDPEGDFRQSLKSSRVLLEQLNATNAQVQRTLVQAEQSIARIERSAAGTLRGAEQAVDKVNSALPGLVNNLNRTSANLADASEQVKRLSTTSAEAVPPILNDVRETTGAGKRAVSGATRSWPLKALVPPERALPLPVDSQLGLPLPQEERR